MKIQYIAKTKPNFKTKHELFYAPLDSPRTFDAYDLNIISLQDGSLWQSKSLNTKEIDEIKDLQSLSASIRNSAKANVIVLFPGNYSFSYYNRSGGKIFKKLKDMLLDVNSIISWLLPNYSNYELIYELSSTKCSNEQYEADFYFNGPLYETLTKNVGGEHPTTIKVDYRLIFSTLLLNNSQKSIDDFINAMGLCEDKTKAPEWVKEFNIYDDDAQKEIVRNANEEICKLKESIEKAEARLEKNLFYKSVLFENGDNLVRPVAEMLEMLTGVSLAGFVDEKKEDFNIPLDVITFVGEIKGVTSNVKNEHVSQLDVHCQSYIDALQESGKTENVKGLLIINPFRTKPLEERDDIHENQIRLAQRNGSLIIPTHVFLLLFSYFLLGYITREDVIDLFRSKTGLLSHSDISQKEK